jgi:hypothetical protein
VQADNAASDGGSSKSIASVSNSETEHFVMIIGQPLLVVGERREAPRQLLEFTHLIGRVCCRRRLGKFSRFNDIDPGWTWGRCPRARNCRATTAVRRRRAD